MAAYAEEAAGVAIDLAAGKATTASGTDTLIFVENLLGSAFADELGGNGGVNDIEGGDGDDQPAGRDGGDWLSGGAGVDTVVYADEAAAVSADFGLGLASSGTASTTSPRSIISKVRLCRHADRRYDRQSPGRHGRR